MVTNIFTNSTTAEASEVNENFDDIAVQVQSKLGEVKLFALSLVGAVTIESLQALGWAICDGTTSASQGIVDASIVTPPDLQELFIVMSDDETSGTTGGSETHAHTITITSESTEYYGSTGAGAPGTYALSTVSILPPFYELAYFMKVKIW